MRRPEDDIQRAVCQWLEVQERLGKLTWYAIPNGGKRSKIEAAIMKGLGVRAGIPDLLVLCEGRSLYIELKAPENKLTGYKGGKVSKEQQEAMERLETHGASCVVCWSTDEAIAAVTAFKEKTQ